MPRTHDIAFERLAADVAKLARRGQKSGRFTLAELRDSMREVIDPDQHGSRASTASEKWFRDKAKGRERFELREDQLDDLALYYHQWEERSAKARVLRPRDIWVRWLVDYSRDYNDATDKRAIDVDPVGLADYAIAITQPGTNVLPPESLVNRWVAVFVDKVRLRQYDEGSDRESIQDGEYVRIEHPTRKYGSVGLLLDDQSPDGPWCCLAAQWRHAPRIFMCEAPRGFFDPLRDRNPYETMEREARDESGVELQSHRNPLVHLRRAYTDTGKLADDPSFFIVFVDRNRPTEELRREPRVAPLWYKVEDVYRAIFSEAGYVHVNYDPFNDAWLRHYRKHLIRPLSEALGTRLQVQDCFTITVAMLALPRMMILYPGLPWREMIRGYTPPV
jgi:hypothetical protein